MPAKKITPLLCILAAAMALGAGCQSVETKSADGKADTMAVSADSTDAFFKITPKGAKPAWAPGIHPEMQAVIEQLASYNAPPIETLTAEQARKNPTPTNAVMDLIKEYNLAMPMLKVDTTGKEIPVKGGSRRT